MAIPGKQPVGNRLVPLPARPPEVGYKLSLIPAYRVQGDKIVPPPPFDKLLEGFRQGQAKFSAYEAEVFAIPVGTHYEESDHRGLGEVRLWANEPGKGHIFFISVPTEWIECDWFVLFKKLADEAGLRLPIELKDHLDWCAPTTPFAWWIATMWAFGREHPSPLPTGVGSVMPNVFERSVRAIERCECLSVAGTAADDLWSVPLSKPEIARRITGVNRPTRKQIEKVLLDVKLKQFKDAQDQVHPKLWTARIDGLSNELQQKFRQP